MTGQKDLSLWLQFSSETAMYWLYTKWYGEGSFPPWGLLGKVFVIAYDEAWKITYRFLTRRQSPQWWHLWNLIYQGRSLGTLCPRLFIRGWLSTYPLPNVYHNLDSQRKAGVQHKPHSLYTVCHSYQLVWWEHSRNPSSQTPTKGQSCKKRPLLRPAMLTLACTVGLSDVSHD